MTDLSPMERAVRALALAMQHHLPVTFPEDDDRHPATMCCHTSDTSEGEDARVFDGPVFHRWHVAERIVTYLARLRTSDPEAWQAVLSECGIEFTEGLLAVSEGQAVVEGRVVDLEEGVNIMGGGTGSYRVKPERSDRHTEDAS